MRNILVFFAMFISSLSFSQDRGVIRGTLQDDQQQAIEFAALLLRSNIDSSIVKTCLSAEQGQFEFLGAPYGDYFVEVSFLGYQDYFTDVFTLNQAEYTIPPITMTNASIELATAVVTSRRPFIERKLDRTVVNVEGSLLASGGSAIDVLDTSPGLAVSTNGTISLSGKDGVLVFVDGKPSHLSGADLTAFLESLSADELSQIEIMANPPAKYDATGNAGIINIKTKKSKLKGYNGSLSMVYRHGRFPQFTPSTTFNYRNQKFNFFGTLSWNSKKAFNDTYITRNIRDLNTKELQTIYQQTTDLVYDYQNINTKIGVDYSISDRTTMGLVGKLYNMRGDGVFDHQIQLKNPDGIIDQSLLSGSTIDYGWDDISLDWKLDHRFNDSTDHSISFDLGYVYYDDFETEHFSNQFYDGLIEDGEAPFLIESSRLYFPENYKIYSAQSDYYLPFSGGLHSLELGVKSSFVEMDILSDYFNMDSELWVKDPALSNHFLYTEWTNAAYANLVLQLGERWAAQAGLRVEQNIATGDQLIRDISFKKKRWNAFPTAYLSYVPGEMHNFGISYGRRIKRPDYDAVDPYRIYIDEFTYEEGNINLVPQLSENFGIDYLGFGGLISASAYYNKIDDVIMEVVSQDVESKETVTRPENLAQSEVLGINLNSSTDVTDFLTTTVFLNVYHKNTSGTANDQPFSLAATTFDGRIMNTARLGNDWSVGAAAFYTSQSIQGTFLRKPFGRLSLVLKKRFLDGNASARLSVHDVFGWNKYDATSNFQNIDIANETVLQNRYVRFSLTYKFRKGKAGRKPSSTSSNKDETDRLKSDAPE